LLIELFQEEPLKNKKSGSPVQGKPDIF